MDAATENLDPTPTPDPEPAPEIIGLTDSRSNEARLRQRDFYLDMSERFAKMAAEYDVATQKEPPLPVHGITAVITLHASDHNTLAREVHDLDVNWYHMYSGYGQDARRDQHGGRESVRYETIMPEQTEESYGAQLKEWSTGHKLMRSGS